MQTRKQNINTQLFVTMLTACLSLLIVGTSSQEAQAKNLIREELTRVYVSNEFEEDDLSSLQNADETNFRKRLVRKVRNLLNDFNFSLSTNQGNDVALGLFTLPKQEFFELPQASFISYQSQQVSTYNNHTLTVSNLARASL